MPLERARLVVLMGVRALHREWLTRSAGEAAALSWVNATAEVLRVLEDQRDAARIAAASVSHDLVDFLAPDDSP
jgi:hypothetical protein